MNNENETSEKDQIAQESQAAASPQPETQPASPLDDITEMMDLGMGQKGTWIGQLTKKWLDKFLITHKSDWEKLASEEKAKIECQMMFDCFTKALVDSATALDALRIEIDRLTCNLAETIFRNRIRFGGDLESLLGGDAGKIIVAADLVTRHGKKILEMAEAEHSALVARFKDWQHSKRVVLRTLKLI